MSKASRTIHTPENSCPYCNHVFNACSPPSGLDSPSPGDLSVCIHCGGLLELKKDLTVQALEEKKLMQIRFADPEAFAVLMKVRDGVLSIQKERVKGGDRHD